MSNGDTTRANSFDRRAGILQTLKAIELGVGKSILDIGCGIGQFTPMFLSKFERVVGLDPSSDNLREARKTQEIDMAGGMRSAKVEYVEGWGETFEFKEKFDTISMDNLLEHVADPVAVFRNCKKHLAVGGRIVAQVPNAESVTRRLGVLMGLIDSLGNISDRERNVFGHQRTYTRAALEADAKKAGLRLIESGGILYKPLPNDMLEKICLCKGEQWAKKFIDALLEFGRDRPEECAYVYVVCD